MLDMKIFKQSLAYAAFAALYVTVVAAVMRNAQTLFGGNGPDTVLAPMGILMLLVVSAATMGLLIFGKPVMLYIDGKKREAVTMASCTVGILAAFTVLVFVVMAASRG
jgi:hypothetical protein